MSTTAIIKNTHNNTTQFNVIGEESVKWFSDSIGTVHKNGKWELDTFEIIDTFSNKDKIYIDIGAWIGPTVLYAANKFNKIICFEPDPVAYDKLINNININNFDNITVVKKAISNTNATANFGGNGKLGNSMSTLLVNLENNEWTEANWITKEEKENKELTIVTTTTLEEELIDNNINYTDINLIKIDIEGGEIFVIPQIENFLSKYKHTLYISLHYVFVEHKKIYKLLDILFNIYSYCYIFDIHSNSFIKVDIILAKNKYYTSLIFTEQVL